MRPRSRSLIQVAEATVGARTPPLPLRRLRAELEGDSVPCSYGVDGALAVEARSAQAQRRAAQIVRWLKAAGYAAAIDEQ